MCTSGKDPQLYLDLLEKVKQGAEQAERDPAPDQAADRDQGRLRPRPRGFAHESCNWWAALALTPEQKEGVEDPLEMERLADENVDKAHTRFIVSNDPEEVVERIATYVDLGFDELLLHAPGPDQNRFLDQFGADVLPLMRDRWS